MSARGRAATLGVALGAALGAGAAGCGDATGVARDGSVRVRATRDSVRVENRSREPVFSVTVGAEAAALIDWYPCVDAARCPPIPAGGVRTAARPAIRGRPEAEAIVYWWRIDSRSAADLLRPDSVRAVRVRFP